MRVGPGGRVAQKTENIIYTLIKESKVKLRKVK